MEITTAIVNPQTTDPNILPDTPPPNPIIIAPIIPQEQTQPHPPNHPRPINGQNSISPPFPQKSLIKLQKNNPSNFPSSPLTKTSKKSLIDRLWPSLIDSSKKSLIKCSKKPFIDFQRRFPKRFSKKFLIDLPKKPFIDPPKTFRKKFRDRPPKKFPKKPFIDPPKTFLKKFPKKPLKKPLPTPSKKPFTTPPPPSITDPSEIAECFHSE